MYANSKMLNLFSVSWKTAKFDSHPKASREEGRLPESFCFLCTAADTHVVKPVVDVLRGRDGVRGGQQTVDHAEFLVHDVDQRGCAVGRARRVRDHQQGLFVLAEVHASHEHRNVAARRADDHFFRARHDVFLPVWEMRIRERTNFKGFEAGDIEIGWVLRQENRQRSR